MNAVFSKVLNMSLTASVVILAVLAARYFLRKSPKVISYALWAVVLFRLLSPVSLTAPISLLEATQPNVMVNAAGTSHVSYLPESFATLESSNEIAATVDKEGAEIAPVAGDKNVIAWNWMTIVSWIWLAGVSAMIIHSMVSYQRLRRCLTEASSIETRVFLADGIPTPFVMGLLKPEIYLPSDTPMEEQAYILAHERHHIRRGDHVIKLLAYTALCIHWFNPLVWAAFFLANKDMEMSCDEAVIRKLGPEIRADYAQTLINMASNRPIIAGMPLAFGEGDTKSRVKNMVKWRKPKTWVVIMSVLVSVLVLVSCAVNPEATESTEASEALEETTPKSVAIGLKIPFDLEAVADEKEIQFRPVNVENGEVSQTPWGGVKTYQPSEYPLNISNMETCLRDLGVPQIVDGMHDYMASSSTYADLEVSFADAGGRETYHYYFSKEESIFEVWFDTRYFDDMTQAAILGSVFFAPDASIERSLPMMHSEFPEKMAADVKQWEESVYLERCRSVLESIQGEESYCIKILRNNYGRVFLNDTATTTYFQNGEDWLLIHKIPESGFVKGVNQFGYMTVNGEHFSNEDQGMDENEDLIWAPVQSVDSALPWIATFDWNAQDVLYVSKIPAGKGLCFTLQVMAPYYSGNPDSYPYYHMQFIFNENGEFDRIENTFYFHKDQERDYSSKETILFLEDSAEDAIAYEYQRYLRMQ